jgi:chromosomal replication initiator protein
VLTGIWDEFLTLAKEEAGSRVVETWFKAVSLYRWEPLQKAVYLQAPNTFVKDWIKNNYMSLFQMHLGRLLNVESPKIIFLDALLESEQSDTVNRNAEPRVMNTMPAVQSKGEIVKINNQKNQSHINSNYLFTNFIVGPSNSLAYAASQAITEKPGKLYNPLFIYGGSGLGKTHLLHAIGNELKNQNKGASVLYQPADRFVNEFISAIRFDKIHKFQAKYKDVDVLLIDDIQFISNKEQTQEAFFHIFNALYDAHKQIIFSSDTFPQNIQGIAERLRSRLAWGLVTDIHAPSLETKIAILKKKAELNGTSIGDDVAHFIASRVVSNIRELEGALVRVVAFSSLTKQPINLELARKVLIRTHETVTKALDLDTIARNVGRLYSFALEDLQSKNRNKELAFARQIAMFLMKKLTDKSFRDIGIYLGGRDHSTVMHAVEKISILLLDNQELNVKLKCFEDELGK